MAAASSSCVTSFVSFFSPSQRPRFPASSQASFVPSPGSKDRGLPLISTNEVQHSPSSQIMSVVCPSLAYANTYLFRSAYNVQVIVDDNEPEEKLLGRFRREVMRAGVIQECKRRRFFETKQDEKKRKSREAAKRNRRRRPQSRTGPQDRQETSKSNKKVEEEDNWEMPDVDDVPYLS